MTFVHAFEGCETTSTIYGMGKISILKLLEKSKSAKQYAEVFLEEDLSHDEICDAETKILHYMVERLLIREQIYATQIT